MSSGPSKPYERYEDEEYDNVGEESRLEYAGFWIRVIPSLIDSVIVMIVNTSINLITVMGANFISQEPFVQIGVAVGNFVINQVVGWLYEACLTSSELEATLGKRAFNLRVTDLNGKRISFARSTGRYFAKFLSGLTLGVGYIMAGFTEKKQALHDLMCETLVVKGSSLERFREDRDDDRDDDEDHDDDMPRIPSQPDERIRSEARDPKG